MLDLRQYQFGTDPDLDAWLINFFTENHLAYAAFPQQVASPEQLKFIVHMDGQPFYYPCSDALFYAIIEKKGNLLLTSAYSEIWQRLERLVNHVIEDDYRRSYLLSLMSTKYQHEISSRALLPSRMEKRLLGIFTTMSEIPRPMAEVKDQENLRTDQLLHSPLFRAALNSKAGLELSGDSTLDDIDFHVHSLRLQRLLRLACVPDIWRCDKMPDIRELYTVMNRPIESAGWDWLCSRLRKVMFKKQRRYILWIGAQSGEVVFDLAVIRLLIKVGFRVIFSVKQAFCGRQISFLDLLEDPVLERLLGGSEFIGDQRITKNEMLGRMHSDNRLLVISDGTRESFNPLLTSVTFARAFKEADLVINRCHANLECLRNRFEFTRDVLSIISEEKGELTFVHKAHHPAVLRFSAHALRHKANQLIFDVRQEKEKGKSIMFYSAIVGSIPGQLKVAKRILETFVDHLRSTLENVVVINPGEHFEEGMDADDIMYMWEIFQRSGVIDTWRFQTVGDVEKGFELMAEKVPPEWAGKDATYSTGCTKEMSIAMDMQRHNPEMQIIGPAWKKFQRRKEYGVGKLYDRVLSDDE